MAVRLKAPASVTHEVPDAVAVFDDAGELVGWDESAAHTFLDACGLPSLCDAECVTRRHVDLW